jgi:hypothetical protein
MVDPCRFPLSAIRCPRIVRARSARHPVIAGLTLLFVLSLGLSGLPGSANGVIRGRVQLRNPPADYVRRPNPGEIGMPASHGATDRRRSVVYLDPAPRAAFDAREEPRARMDQRNETFEPHVLAIVAGTVVDFPNNDATYHNVFSLSREKTFDLGRLLRYPRAHERVHPRLLASVLRHHGR